jgi:hypothetical protein
MGVQMDNLTVLRAEPLVGLLVGDKADMLPALADTVREAELPSPSPWFEHISPADGELGMKQPSAARRGLVEKLSGDLYLHFSAKCGAWGAFGYGVSMRGGLGRWYCAAHRPRGKFSSAQPVEGYAQ